MVKAKSKAERKGDYFAALGELLSEYSKILLVNADNVGSNQLQHVRKSLRGKAVVLMGKNTLIRKVVRGFMNDNPALEKLLPAIRGNVGFIFTHDDLADVRDIACSNKVKAPARAGALAPVDVFVPAGPTGMDPSKTQFFQALNIPTQIVRGFIEIKTEQHLVKVGDKVGASEAALLNMLNISPFSYGLVPERVYDNGQLLEPSVLDITDEDLLKVFQLGINNIAALSLQINYPTKASAPHSIVNGFKKLLAIAAATEYSFPAAEELKKFLADPSAFAVAAPAASEEKKDAPKKEATPEPSSDEEMGFGMFGDD